jgi:hypothetical protein
MLKLQISFHSLLIKGVLNIKDTNMAAEKYSRLYINVFIFRIYNMSKESMLWVQSLNATCYDYDIYI